jgi:hypothetical protein
LDAPPNTLEAALAANTLGWVELELVAEFPWLPKALGCEAALPAMADA